MLCFKNTINIQFTYKNSMALFLQILNLVRLFTIITLEKKN